MKKILALSLCLMGISAAARADGPMSINLPAGGSVTIGDTVVNCSAQQGVPEARYICSKDGVSAEGSSIDAAFVQLQGMLSADARCFDDMTASCEQSWCARE